MKIIHNINKWSFIITLLLYITIYYGLIAQFFLGCIQVIIALMLFVFWKKLKTKPKQHLFTYSGVAIVYGLLLWLTDIVDSDFGFVFVTIVPMSIAGYFLFITWKIKKSNNEFKSHSI